MTVTNQPVSVANNTNVEQRRAEVDLCIACAAPAILRWDRKRGTTLYLSCAFCGTRLFCRSLTALNGLRRVVRGIRAERDAFRAALHEDLAAAYGSEQPHAIDPVVAAERDELRRRGLSTEEVAHAS